MSNTRIEDQVSPEFRPLVDDVLAHLSNVERQQLPKDIGGYVHAITRYALNDLATFGERLAEVITNKLVNNRLERFIQDPLRGGALLLDAEGHIVSLDNVKLGFSQTNPPYYYIESYESYIVLTGPESGRTFDESSRPLKNPKYKPDVIA